MNDKERLAVESVVERALKSLEAGETMSAAVALAQLKIQLKEGIVVESYKEVSDQFDAMKRGGANV